MENKSANIVFFGTPQIAVWVLEELEKAHIVPSLIITNPDKPQGRKMMLTSPPVKLWAEERGIRVMQPGSLRDPGCITTLQNSNSDLFVVVAYGKMIPAEILNIPRHGVLNVHPSLLPKLRGASPIRSAILNDLRETGVTVMLMDEELDHGPVVAQKKVTISENDWPMRGRELDEVLAKEGGGLLAETLPRWLSGEAKMTEQNHDKATFCTKITKEMGVLDLSADPYKNLLKIRAFDGWPGTFFYAEKNRKNIRVKITEAELTPQGSLNILRVIPEGKKEIAYASFVSAQ